MSRILVAEGEVVPVGTVLVVIGDDAGAPDETEASSAAATAPEARVGSTQARAGDSARSPPRAEAGVDLAQLSGTGPNGRITETDVGTRRARSLCWNNTSLPRGRREPCGVRRQIVEHLTTAHREVAAVTFVEECDFTGLDTKELLPHVLQVAAAALKEFPELNARLEGDEIVYLDRYDIGVAVQTDQGLVVPVVRGCDSACSTKLAAEVERLAKLPAPVH